MCHLSCQLWNIGVVDRATLMFPTSWCSHSCVIPFPWVWAGHVTCPLWCWIPQGRNTSTLLSHTCPFGSGSFLALLGVPIWSINSRGPMLGSQACSGLSALCFCIRAPTSSKISSVMVYSQKWGLVSWVMILLGWCLNSKRGKKTCPTSIELRG